MPYIAGMADDINLEFIARQLDRVLNEQRDMRTLLGALSSIRDEQHAQRTELQLLREQVRLARADIARIEDTLTMNVLDRLRALEGRA
jgi:hypothetical protein